MGIVLHRAQIRDQLEKWNTKSLKVVLTNGCFDLLHTGHLKIFREAKKLGDILVVGLNSDCSVKAVKGPERPFNAQADRAQLVAALEPVNFVIIFNELTVDTLLETIKPDIYVKGGDYTLDSLPEKETILRLGIKVSFISLVEGISTTEIINKIRNSK